MKTNRKIGLALLAAFVVGFALAADASAAVAAIYALASPGHLPTIAGGVMLAHALPAITLETLPALAKELNDRIGEVKKLAEEYKAKIGEGTLTADLKEKADKALTDTNALKSRIDDFEQKLAKRLEVPTPERPKSLGQNFVASEKYVNARKEGKSTVGRVEYKDISAANAPIDSLRESEVVGIQRRQMRIRDLLSVVPTDSPLIEYWIQTVRTNNAAMVAENAAKPYSNLAWEKRNATAKVIAHMIKVSKQAFDDSRQLAGEIDTELRYGLDLVEEFQLLFGDGTGENLSGLYTNATAYSAPFVVPNETYIDRLRLAALQASLNLFMADGYILHPTDWAKIELTKDAENRYIFANPMQIAGPNLWGLPVVATLAMTVNNFLAAAFKVAATLYDRETTEVLVSTENDDDFEKNRITVRAEKRLALAIKRAQAMVRGNFTGASGGGAPVV